MATEGMVPGHFGSSGKEAVESGGLALHEEVPHRPWVVSASCYQATRPQCRLSG